MNARRRFTTRWEQPPDAEWRPLEAVARLSRLDRALPSFHEGEFMYMGAVTNRRKRLTIHLYKHVDTRRYLNLDDAGHAYEFCGLAPADFDDVRAGGWYRLHRSLDAALAAAELWIFDREPAFARSWPPERWDDAA
jgi:hypothetical protein